MEKINQNKITKINIDIKPYVKNNKKISFLVTENPKRFISPPIDYFLILNRLKMNGNFVSIESLNDYIYIVQEILNYINILFGLNFEYKKLNESQNVLIFQTDCVFNNQHTQTSLVNIFAHLNFYCGIHCHHASCQNENKYIPVINILNQNLLILKSYRDQSLFEQTNQTIEEIFFEIENKN